MPLNNFKGIFYEATKFNVNDSILTLNYTTNYNHFVLA
ncbi:hypothetical protein M2273_005752 [Mucilaginibacter lappiensis]